ncbi:hypothetical protein [Streptomyces sp. NBC_01591]|uniref:hypothetical protein n=1 Tax=Streptomyces sp. NBC_01591 TaxID=2975888 RepID=UPI002DD8DD96|nr:hypothetical protein [Streptomyces sp. NBC_01591]
MFEGVNIPWHPQFIEDGRFQGTEVMEQAATAMLDELLRTEAALRPMRLSAGQNGAGLPATPSGNGSPTAR